MRRLKASESQIALGHVILKSVGYWFHMTRCIKHWNTKTKVIKEKGSLPPLQIVVNFQVTHTIKSFPTKLMC